MNSNLSFGAQGVKITSAQGATAGPFSIVNCLADAVFTCTVNWVNAGSPETITVTAGQSVYGVFSTITVTSGTIVAYK